MSETKFTKGEWSAWGERVGIIDKSDSQANGMMMEVAYIEKYDFPDEYIANANLIAAAPDMYAMLEYLREDYGLLTDVGKDIDKLLAKARGE